MENSIFRYPQDFNLESGSVLPGFDLAYRTFGKLSPSGNNVVWVFHAFTGNANPTEWWDGLVGEGKFFNPGNHFIVCVNMPGSCYGSTGPLSHNRVTAQPWYHDFPIITTRDMARMFALLQRNLGIGKIQAGIGGSMGGMVLLEWSIEEPELFENIILIATNAVQSAWGIAFNETQRMAIESDTTWLLKNESAGLQGMATARAIALLSYRNYHPYKISQGESDPQKLNNYRGSSYQQYQGLKLTRRFNAFSYHALTKSMDAHHIGRGRSSVAGALRSITAKTLVVGIQSDLLFPVEEQKLLASHIPDAQFACIDSTYGHDGFLIEYQQLEKIIGVFLFSPRRREDANITQSFKYDLAS
jgi:homoserine O-acetyltransferase